jgi:hypothetical protein
VQALSHKNIEVINTVNIERADSVLELLVVDITGAGVVLRVQTAVVGFGVRFGSTKVTAL